MKSSKDDHRRQPAREKGTAASEARVKPGQPEQRVEASTARDEGKSSAELWTMIWSKENMLTALKRAESNAGAPGIDGMTVKEMKPYLKEHWVAIRAALDQQTYRPSPVRRVEIPKPDGGVRLLGIPTVVDRLIQQAIAQQLTPLYEPLFSTYSYGFRPGRSAHDAVKQAQEYVQAGYEWAVDIDLEKFFDRVNHDMLMARVARVVQDKRVLKLIRAYLESGVMINGVVVETEEGTPQGGPLSPLLSNIMLDDLDRELEQRRHRFVRYADDCNIYVKTQRAGERVMASVKAFLEKKLKLKVNLKKSKVDLAKNVTFLGFCFKEIRGEMRIWIADRSFDRFRMKLRRLTKRTRSGTLETIITEINRYTMGWVGYFRLANTATVFRELDQWIRRRLRQLVWKRWKRGRTRYRELVALGVPAHRAALGAVWKSPWHMSLTPVVHEGLNNAYWKQKGLASIIARYDQLRVPG